MSTSSANSTLADNKMFPPAPKGSGDSNGVRFTLRKRSARPNDRDSMTLSSYNSAFLTGLFADVAKANVLSELEIQEESPVCSSSAEEAERPAKRSRLSLSSYRSRASFMNLSALSAGLHSPKGVNEITSFQHAAERRLNSEPRVPSAKSPSETKDSKSLSAEVSTLNGGAHRQDSLAFQLSLLDGSDKDTPTATPSEHVTAYNDVAKLAFPNLPVTVSDSSCTTGLTRDTSAQQVSISENGGSASSNVPNKDSSFGWFVDLDDQPDEITPLSALPHSVSQDELAFQAPTAPKRPRDTSDIEWAQAADTIDSVLGDLF